MINPYLNSGATSNTTAASSFNLQPFSYSGNSQPVSAQSLSNLGLVKPQASTAGSVSLASAGSPLAGIAQAAPQSKGLGALGAIGQGVDILGGLASIYQGFQATKLAKKNLNFQVGAYNNNLVNSTQSYNTNLEDRINARHFTEGKSSAQTDSYLSRHRLRANQLST